MLDGNGLPRRCHAPTGGMGPCAYCRDKLAVFTVVQTHSAHAVCSTCEVIARGWHGYEQSMLWDGTEWAPRDEVLAS